MRSTSQVSVESSLQIAREMLNSAKNVVVLTGAGISAESGVPTFRSSHKLRAFKGIPVEQISSAKTVEENLPLLWEWFDHRLSLLDSCTPNAGHKAIARWQERFENFTLVTQNVDGLHQKAGSKNVIELHGNIRKAHCTVCGCSKDIEWIPKDERPPQCECYVDVFPRCEGYYRPSVVLFGEYLNNKVLNTAFESAIHSDVFVCVGTSAVVFPAANVISKAAEAGSRMIEINPEETEASAIFNVKLRGKAAEILPEL